MQFKLLFLAAHVALGFRSRNPVVETSDFNPQPFLDVAQSSILSEVELEEESIFHDYFDSHQRVLLDLQRKIDDTVESERAPLLQERDALQQNLWEGFSKFFGDRFQTQLDEAKKRLEERIRAEAGENFQIQWPLVEERFNLFWKELVEEAQRKGEIRRKLIDSWRDQFESLVRGKCEETEIAGETCRKILLWELNPQREDNGELRRRRKERVVEVKKQIVEIQENIRWLESWEEKVAEGEREEYRKRLEGLREVVNRLNDLVQKQQEEWRNDREERRESSVSEEERDNHHHDSRESHSERSK